MSRYLDKQIAWFEGIQAQIEQSSSPAHKKILRNFMSHAAYELVGETERLLGPEYMVDEPVYIIQGMGDNELREYRGKESVKQRFYDDLNQGLVLAWDDNSSRAVEDWGLAMFMTVGLMLSGKQVIDMGMEADDPDARYIVEYYCAERWPFDELGRVAGEEVYQVGDPKITKLSPEDDLTLEQRNAAVRRFLPEPAELAS